MKESGHPVISLDLSVPDEETAKKAVSGWKEKSSELYQQLVEMLLG